MAGKTPPHPELKIIQRQMPTFPASPTTVTPLTPGDREFLIELVKEMLVNEYLREVKHDTEGHEDLTGDRPCAKS